jgi:hypothetical protein
MCVFKKQKQKTMELEKQTPNEVVKKPIDTELAIIASNISRYSFQRVSDPNNTNNQISTQTDQLDGVVEQAGHDQFHSLGHSMLQEILAKTDNTLVAAMQELKFDKDNPAGFDVSGERVAMGIQYILRSSTAINYETPQGKRIMITMNLENMPTSDNPFFLAWLSAKDSIVNLDLMKYEFSEEYYMETYRAMLEPERIKQFFETPNLKSHDFYTTFYRACFVNTNGLDSLRRSWDPKKPKQQLSAIQEYFENQEITYDQMSEFYTTAFLTEVNKLIKDTAGLNEIATFFDPLKTYVRDRETDETSLLTDIQKVLIGLKPSPLLEPYNKEFQNKTGLSINMFSKGIQVITDAVLSEYLSQIPEEYISRGPDTITIDYDPKEYTQSTRLENDLLISQAIEASRNMQMPWELVSSDLDESRTNQLRAELDEIIGTPKKEYLELKAQLKDLKMDYNKNWREIDIIQNKIRKLTTEIFRLTLISPGKEIIAQMRYYEYGFSDIKDKPKDV